MGNPVLTSVEPADEADESSPGGRRRWIWIASAIVVVVIALVLAFVVFWNRDTSRPVSIDEARQRADAEGYGQDAVAPAPLWPVAGVYVYRGEGIEQLDKPPTSPAQGPQMPGTVTHLDGDCWSFRIDYSTNH